MRPIPIIYQDYFGTGLPIQVAASGINYYDTSTLSRYTQQSLPYGKQWVITAINVLPAIGGDHKVLADALDPIPGYLNAKVDGTLLIENPLTHKILLGNTAVAPGTYGDATHVGQFTVDQQGRITSATDVLITGGSATPAGLTTWVQYNLAGVFAADANFIRDPALGYFIMVSDDGASNNITFSQIPVSLTITANDAANNQGVLYVSGASITITSSQTVNISTINTSPAGFFMSNTDGTSFAYSSWDLITGSTINYLGTINFGAVIIDNTNLSIINRGITWLWPLVDGSAGYVMTTDGFGNLSLAAPSGGTITGTGIAGSVTYWDSTTNITADLNFLWNATNYIFKVGDIFNSVNNVTFTVDDLANKITLSTPFGGVVNIPSLTASAVVLTDASKNLTTVVVLTTANGGTGLASYTQGDLLYYTSGTLFSKLAKNTTATRYLSNQGTSNAPSWNQITLTNGVTGILPVANGGTGTSTAFTAGSVVFAGASGIYAQDNANLFWDDTNNWLGIGNAVPLHPLHIKNTANQGIALARTTVRLSIFTGNGTTYLVDENYFISTSTNVHFQTLAGVEQLTITPLGIQIFDTTPATPAAFTVGLRTEMHANGGNVWANNAMLQLHTNNAADCIITLRTTGTNEKGAIYLDHANQNLNIASNFHDIVFIVGLVGTTEAARITFDGKFGIGNPSPAEILDVIGNFNLSGNMYMGGVILSYFGNPTAGIGVAPIYAEAELMTQTTTQDIVTYTPLLIGMFRIGCWLNINAVVGATLQMSCSYNDENGVSRSQKIPTASGVLNITTAGAYIFPDVRIRTDGSADIIVSATLTVAGVSIDYDAGASVEQISSH